MIFENPFEVAFDDPASIVKYKTYSLDSILINVPRVTYDSDALLKGSAIATYRASARVGVETPTYQADAILVLDPNDPRLSDSYINALMWAFANEWRKAARAIELLELRMKLDYAQTDDLDDYWGVVLGLRRKGSETDDDYRTRLAIRITILTSCGTKANCQAVIDRITGMPGGSLLETFAPARVVLSWTSPDAIAAALPKTAMISAAMDEMVAAGISWSTSYPLVSYQADGITSGNELATYQASGAISKLRGYVYHMSASMWDTEIVTYRADGALQTSGSLTYRMQFGATADHSCTYSTDSIMTLVPGVTYRADGIVKAIPIVTYRIDGFAEEPCIASYECDTIAQKQYRLSYVMGGTVS